MFGNKGQEMVKQPPVDKVKVMSRMGIGEKEIVKQLKTEGYSFSEIESAMMTAMKEGIDSSSQSYQQPQQYPQQNYPPAFQQPPIQSQDTGLSWPKLERPEEMFPENNQQELSPEIAMEDLIENITYEKFEKYSKQLSTLNDIVDSLEDKIKSFEEKSQTKAVFELPREYEERLDSIESKVNGLEKAFRQILPSLTKSVEELKSAIDTMHKNQPVSVTQPTNVPDQQIYEKYYPSIPLFPQSEQKELKQEA
ncbi:MAG: hypothetical protein HY831_01745 [Candidatus Aenigmarchaeota archaeon]|nr:hypothetical protein [Candidatus Aenigmarchaeota archaeon]